MKVKVLLGLIMVGVIAILALFFIKTDKVKEVTYNVGTGDKVTVIFNGKGSLEPVDESFQVMSDGNSIMTGMFISADDFDMMRGLVVYDNENEADYLLVVKADDSMLVYETTYVHTNRVEQEDGSFIMEDITEENTTALLRVSDKTCVIINSKLSGEELLQHIESLEFSIE